MEKKPLIILAGPTASGKSELSLRLAKDLSGEIVSADSMQVYRGMDIGSAKLPMSQRRGIPHHLLDICDPEEDYNVVRFQKEARKAMAGIYERGHVPILVGGTGFYIQAVLYDIDFTEQEEDGALREELERKAREEGPEALHKELARLDPEAALAIHPNNIKRVVRAMEFALKTGERISVHNETERQKESPYRFAFFVLNRPRQELYERIDQRVDEMMEEGLLSEVQALYERGFQPDQVSMQGLGYKQLLQYFTGSLSLEEAVYQIKRDTRHFAKRQLTWFKRERDTIWVNRESFADGEELYAFVLEKARESCGLSETMEN